MHKVVIDGLLLNKFPYLCKTKEKDMKKVLAVLSLLIIIGLSISVIGCHNNLIRTFGYVSSLIGGLAFGRLLYLTQEKSY